VSGRKVNARFLLRFFALGGVGWGEAEDKTVILVQERIPKKVLGTIVTFFCSYFGLKEKDVEVVETGPFFRLETVSTGKDKAD